MEIHISDLGTYFKDHVLLIIVFHALLLVLVTGLVLNITRNWKREKQNEQKLAVRSGTYMALIERDLKILFGIFIAYVLLFPFIFGFINISLY